MRGRNVFLVLAIVAAAAVSLFLIRSNRHAEPPSALSGAPTLDPLHDDIYPDGARAPSEIAEALSQAGRENKRVILDFGGNWCPDCRVLEIYFHDPSNRQVLDTNYVLVHVNIGRYDLNQELAAKYGVALEKGVPALAVLAPSGQLLYSQRNGEFEAMSRMDPASVSVFLNTWKPQS